jgi:TonB family protein
MGSGERLRLRLVLIWGDTVVCERVLAHGRVATVGEDPRNTLVLPDVAGIGRKHALFTPTPGGYVLAPTLKMQGWLRRAGQEHALAPDAMPRVVDPETEGALEIGAFQVLFHFVDAGATLPPPTLWQRLQDVDTNALGALALAFLLQVGLLIGAYALWDDAPRLTDLGSFDRPVVCAFATLPPPPPPSEEVAERPENEPGKRAGRDEGRFGKPEEKQPSKIPKHEGALVDKVAAQTLTRALTSNLMGGGPLQNVFGGQTAFADRLNAAMAGNGDVLVMGSGTGGMGIRGLGNGGGGEGFGRIGGMGKFDVGGGGGAHVGLGRKTPKPRPSGVVMGRSELNGFCREADIQKVVMARRNGPAYCYEKALARDPELSGKVMLNWRIGTDGKVQKVIVESSTLGDPEVAQCVARQVERWTFPPTEGGVCQIRYPFVFTGGQ